MDILSLLLNGFAIAFEPLNLALIIFGCAVGLFIGAMPGLGSVNGVAILLPMTFLVPPTGAIIFLGAIYYGAMYGGAISSIMLGIPGASTAVATTFDGRPMALQGKADKALVAAAAASFVGGSIGVVLFTLFAPPLADIALGFGAPEIFALMLMAFATFVGLAIGIYGLGEMLWTIEISKGNVMVSQASVSVKGILKNLVELIQTWKAMLLGSFLGYFVGILPAAGATPGSLMAYGFAKQMAKDPETYGKGNINGVVAPESANNAASTGAMLPMLTLGIPGSPTTAILLGGMVIWGLEPGPMVFIDHPDFVWGFIASLYAANLFSLLINIAFIPAFIWVLKLPFTILAPVIFILCIVGGFVPTLDMHDVWLMLVFGIVGYLMRKLDYPMAPAVLAIVLGPLAEPALRQSLLISGGSFSIFFTRPFSSVFMFIAIALLVLPLGKKALDARRRKTERT